MKRASAALMAKWESRLRSEGMPDEFPATRRQALYDVADMSVAGAPMHNNLNHRRGVRVEFLDGLSASTTYQYWTALAHSANELPRNWKGRAFMVLYAETGYFQSTCTTLGISRRQGRNILARFAQRKVRHEPDTAE